MDPAEDHTADLISSRAWRWLPFAFTALLVAVQIAVVIHRNGGALTYSLDDPYIHLALSDGIAQGHFGIEPRELSAPSSSILWPVLLAPASALPVHEFLPLVLNLAALFTTLGLFARILRRSRLPEPPGGGAFTAGLVSILALALNLTSLAITGMEHSLQVALAVAVALGMIEVDRGRRVPPYLVAAIVAGPLVRYESAALSAAAILFLLLRGRWRPAALAAATCTILVGAFSLFLVRLGLEPLPGPVLENLEATSGSSAWALAAHLWTRIEWILTMLPARILACLTGVLVAVAVATRWSRSALPLCGAVAALLHLSFGSYGGFARYEIYILAFIVALLIYVVRHPLRQLVIDRGAVVGLLVAGALLLPAFSSYAAIAYLTPQAAHNIYQQHVQLHRFVTEHYRGPVAVNDLGRVSYRSPYPVLDLWGLCSTEIRRARLERDPAWPDTFVQRQDIELAMIYDSWFRDRIPSNWRLLARLHLHGQRITPGSATVSFYLTRPGPATELLEHLHDFRAKLPVGTSLEVSQSPETVDPHHD